jgi:hypothetical protein
VTLDTVSPEPKPNAVTLAAELGLTSDAARALADALVNVPDVERRSAASRACRQRRLELCLLADLIAERDGHRPDVDTLALTDPVMAELLLLAIA